MNDLEIHKDTKWLENKSAYVFCKKDKAAAIDETQLKV